MSSLTKHHYHIACIGYPNAGKTSIFNKITGSHYSAVNYPGSTVQYHLANTRHRAGQIHWIDTPGIVTFSPHSDDEKVTHTVLTRLDTILPDAQPFPDLILYIADAFQLERHLIGFKVLQDHGYSVVLIVTRADLTQKYGGSLDTRTLEQLAECPVYHVNSHTGNGLPTPDTLIDFCTKIGKPPIIADSTDMWNAAAKWAILSTKKTLTPPMATNEIDRWALHPKWGGFIFFAVMSAFFFVIFFAASPAMDAIDLAFSMVASTLHTVLPSSSLTQLAVEGLVSNIGAVLVFTPQIFLLFFATSILESSGYLARAAVIVDKPLAKLGLSGRSFVPLLSGSACAIPAILATRTLPNNTERLITLWMIPLMPCSARIPVYGLLLAILFHGNAVKSALGMVIIYALSILLAVTIGKTISVFKPGSSDSFYIELPRWQMPYWPHIFKNAYRQTLNFIKKAGPAIIVISLILWGLSQYPSPDQSWLAHVGQWVAPIFAPMGWDWRIGVALLASFAAREVFVSVLAAMLALNADTLSHQINALHTPLLTTPSSIALIAFFMISMQCGTTIAVIRKETHGWRVPITMTVTYIALAFGIAFAIARLGALI